MKKKIWGILDRDSSFGRAMTLVSIIIGANIMFAIFSLPVVTIGPALAALFHVMFKMLRGHRDLNPIKEFWLGFKSNFKQGFLSSLVFLGIALLLYVDIRFSGHMGGVLTYFKYALYAIAFAAATLAAYLYPVMACFADTLPHLARNAVFFMARNPLKMFIIVALDVVPLFLTYLDERMMPLYGFIWVTCGFALVALIDAKLLLKDFAKFLPKVNEWGEFVTEGEEENGEGGDVA